MGLILKEFNMKAKNLKLIAKTEEDLKVVSAHLQDADCKCFRYCKFKKNKIFDTTK